MVAGKEGASVVSLNRTRRFTEMKGILINTFMELEPHAIDSFSPGTTPPIYPVGPMLNLKHHTGFDSDHIMKWLDKQPPSSVVLLCFGSMGSFHVEQITEIAEGLEHSGFPFLWSLRRPPPKGGMASPRNYSTDLEEVLPERFLDRTAMMGKVFGWAPQASILSHSAIGGFISHCGWNSILESLWYGVPIATWPMYAEQQLNAFQMARELGLVVEIKLDSKKDGGIVRAEEIGNGIRCLMGKDSEMIRTRISEMRERSMKALVNGGSSHGCIGRLIGDMMANIP